MSNSNDRTLEAVRSTASPKAPSSISYLDQALWKEFQAAEDDQSFALAWLSLQCSMITSVISGTVFIKDQQGFSPAAIWPNNAAKPAVDTKALAQTAKLSTKQNKGVVRSIVANKGKPDDETFHVAHPITIDDWIYGVVVLELGNLSTVQLSAVMRQIQWGTSWFETFYRRTLPNVLSSKNEKLAKVIELMNVALEQSDFSSSAATFATELASYLACDRISVGFKKRNNIQVEALSHTAQFDKKTNIIRAMGIAMDESLDQSSVVCFPSHDEGATVNRLQQELISLSGANSVCTVPFSTDGEIIGAITVEHTDETFFNAENVAFLEHIALLAGPLLQLQKNESQWLHLRVMRSTGNLIGKIIGRSHLTVKLAIVVMVCLGVFLYNGVGAFRVSANATLEGWKQSKISAPLDGFISDSFVRAGDIVEQGQLLFLLENKDIQLEHDKWINQKKQVENKYHDAFVRHDKTKVGILKAQLQQADAQLALIKGQLDRTNVTAPFAGVLVSGDLSQMLGAPVEKGKVLMQLAPLERYRIIIDVDEKDITYIAPGQSGSLSLASMPNEKFEFLIDKITPVSSSNEGKNTFRVEAKLSEDDLSAQSKTLRPGMQGTGKISIDERNLLWIWTHGFTDWFALWLWTWLP